MKSKVTSLSGKSMSKQSEQKQQAVVAALALLPPKGVIGLGTGSTADLFIEQVAGLVKQGRDYVGVPTSERSRALATSLGIPLLAEQGPWQIDVTVDGADEVSEQLDLIKGGGACHLHEKIVNASSKANVIVVDESKLSKQLGERWAVPVEVVTFGHGATAKHLAEFGSVKLRLNADKPVITDSGNLVYDVNVGVIPDPSLLEAQLGRIPGVVETGLFVNRASVVIVAGSRGTYELRPAH